MIETSFPQRYAEQLQQLKNYLESLESTGIITQVSYPNYPRRPVTSYKIVEPWRHPLRTCQIVEQAIHEYTDHCYTEHRRAKDVHHTMPGLVSCLLRKSHTLSEYDRTHDKENLVALRDCHPYLYIRLLRLSCRNPQLAQLFQEIEDEQAGRGPYTIDRAIAEGALEPNLPARHTLPWLSPQNANVP